MRLVIRMSFRGLAFFMRRPLRFPGLPDYARTECGLHTRGPAYLTFDEGNRGSLEVGKWADMVVLTEDILSVDPVRIREIGIEKTIIEGIIVYSADIPKIARFDDGVLWTVENLPQE